MLSRFSAKWHWYDWLFIVLALLVIAVAIRTIAPTSGLSISLHTGTHALALAINWVGNGLVMFAGLLNQV